MGFGPHRGSGRCVFDQPKAYLVTACDADAAMSLVKRFAISQGIELIVHRAVEVSETLLLQRATDKSVLGQADSLR